MFHFEGILLSRFDSLRRPTIRQVLPFDKSDNLADLSSELKEQILKLIDTPTADDYFTFGFEQFMTANLYIEVPSDWNRSKREILCLTIITHQEKLELFNRSLIKSAQRLKAIPNLFKAFHDERRERDSEVEQKQAELKAFLAKSNEEVIRVKNTVIHVFLSH